MLDAASNPSSCISLPHNHSLCYYYLSITIHLHTFDQKDRSENNVLSTVLHSSSLLHSPPHLAAIHTSNSVRAVVHSEAEDNVTSFVILSPIHTQPIIPYLPPQTEYVVGKEITWSWIL